MSILLHNISFPPEGEDAIGLFLRWDGTVHLWHPHAFIGHDVEATELPPHGRLIDADEIIQERHQHYEHLSDTFYVTVRDIELAPTIIEAEKEST